MAQSGPSRVCAENIVPGCPNRSFDLLRSSPFPNTNSFLYGSPAAVLNAATSETQHAVHGRFTLAARLPSLWYSFFQRYMPYNSEGLDGRDIAAETANSVLDAQEETETDSEEAARLKNQVWAIVRGIYGDQRWYSLRFGAWFLKHIFMWLFNGELYVDPRSTERLRELEPTSTFLCAP